MIAVNFAWCFSLCALAIWRVAHLVTRENGPWNMIAHLRGALGSGILGRIMDNFYCLSLLVALPPALWMSGSRRGFLMQWMALSVIACLLEKVTQRPHKHLRAGLITSSHLDKVINGV
jgi:hypothetical protein